jgi:hypothetical protein
MSLLDVMEAEDGFTYDPRADLLITSGQATGYAIAVPGTERVVGSGSISREDFADEFVSLVRSYGDLLGEGACIGGWCSPERDVYLIEISEIHHVDSDTAVRLGTARNQEAILELATGELIPTGGNGETAHTVASILVHVG